MQSIYSVNDIKNTLTPVFNEYGVKKAVLFGSYSKGTAKETSDIDLLVDSGLRGLKFVGLIETVRQVLGIEVDMFDVTHILPESLVAREISNTGVVLYEK